MTWTLGTTPDDHYGLYLDGVLWLVIVSETGEAEEELRRSEIVLSALKASQPEEAPYVCPGCHAVAAPCLPGCIDAEIADEHREAIESGNYDREDDDDG